GRADADAQSLDLSGSLPLRRSELCGRHLVVRAVRDGHVQHLVHQAHAARELGVGMTRSRASRIAQRIAAYVTIPLALVLTLFPVYWIAANSLKLDIDIFAVPPEWFPFDPTLKHYHAAFIERPFLRYALNSFIIAVCSTLISLVFGTLAGYALARFQYPGQWRYQISFWIL